MCMNTGPTIGHLGLSARIINGTLMDVYNPEIATSHQIDVFDASDALARNVNPSFVGPSTTISFDVPEGIKVMEDNTDAKPVVVHKIMGKGHVVLFGFDLFSSNNDVDNLLRNSILLHRHVVFDNSHAQGISIFDALSTVAEDLPYHGLSVASMGTFEPAILEASEILVIPYCSAEYTPTERGVIDDFVNNGGGLFIVTEWSNFGDDLDSLINHFGYARNTTHDLFVSDDYYSQQYWMQLYPENLNMHSTKVGVDVVEVYGSTALIEWPESAVPILTTDDDSTTTWMGAEEANGLPIATAELVGEGRIAILADDGPVTNYDWDAYGTDNYYDADNELFTRNLFRWLAGAGIPEKTVVFDQSHSPYLYIHGTWSPLANFLMFNGYNIEWMNVFDPSAYEDADILVICDGSTNYSATEITYLANYVSGGGALLLWGDNTVYCEEIDPIGQEFALFVNTTGGLYEDDDFDTYQGYTVWEGNNIGAHPIMDGVERMEIDLSNAFISIGSGTALLSTDGDGTTHWSDGTPAIDLPIYAATTHNMGRVVFLTDVELGFLSDPDSDGFGDLYDSDNPIFIANVFTWLSENRAPVVEVLFPNGGEVLNGTHIVEWTAVDPNRDELTFDILVSDNNGSDWSLLAAGLTVQQFEWNTTQHDDGTSYMILVEAFDGELGGQDVSDNPFELDNFVGGPGLPIDPMLLAIIGGAIVVIVIILVVILKKKGGGKKK